MIDKLMQKHPKYSRATNLFKRYKGVVAKCLYRIFQQHNAFWRLKQESTLEMADK